MKRKNILTAVLCAVLCINLCGCELLSANTDQLLTPPELQGEMYPIAQALKADIKAEFSLCYPSGGDRRSAVVLEDIDGDGTQEAFAFYTLNADEEKTVHLNIILRGEKGWKSVADQQASAAGVERIDFCDLNGDGCEEILIGWEMSGSSEKQLAVYSMEKRKPTRRMMQKYSEFICCDLNENGENELFIQTLSTADSSNRAGVYELNDDGVVEVSSCLLDQNVKAIRSLTVAALSSGQTAIYVDEIKNAGAVTEVLFMQKNVLVNPLLDVTTAENIRTVRSTTLLLTDINQDSIPEIPVSEELPMITDADSAEKSYYTKWCSFNGEILSPQQTVVINQNDGYTLNIPARWIGNIMLVKDSGAQSRTFYELNADGTAGQMLAEIRAVTKKQWKREKELKTMTEIGRSADLIYIGRAVAGNGPLNLTIEELKKNFTVN